MRSQPGKHIIMRAARWALALLGVCALAFGGVWLGLRVAGPVEKETALGTVSLRVSPALHGDIDAYIPLADWGVRARAFSTPLRLHVEPRTVDRQAVIRAAGGDRRVLAQARRDAARAGDAALLRSYLWTLGGAGLLGLLAAALARRAAGRRLRAALAWGLAPLLVTVLAGGGVLLRAQSTFDADAFEAPHFYARGAELSQLLKVAGNAQREGQVYRSQVERTLSGYASLLEAGGLLRPVETGVPAVLVSDLHANPFVLGAVQRLASGSPVFFAGDFGQSGTAEEARALVPRVTGLGRLVAVSGNHDSRTFMRRLAGAGAIVLTEEGRLDARGHTDGKPVQAVAGMLVAGHSDPLESRSGDPGDPRRIFSFSERPDGEREYEDAQRRIATWFRSLEPRPSIVLIHQNGLAQELAKEIRSDAGPPLLILTGHDHRQHVDRHGSTLIVDAGTVGAGGLLGAGQVPVGVAQLQFAPSLAWPTLIDLIGLDPLTGSAEADRVVVGAPDVCKSDLVVCHAPQ